jgi:hypothetical protein
MYKLGQFIRNQYNQYLGHNCSPQEVYARSSVSKRALESVSCLLAGVYPPDNKQWQWNKGSDAELGLHWQPIPILTFIPRTDDNLLSKDKKCPKAEIEREEIFSSKKVLSLLAENKQFLEILTKFVGQEVNTLMLAYDLYEALLIEYNRG